MDTMQSPNRESPFSLLGQRLRTLRETHRESLAEVSGAVEIDTDVLERIEHGEECPSEDVLTLLISHFSLHEHEAVELWDYAGFERPHDAHSDILGDSTVKTTLVVVGIDARVLYSDGVSVTQNKSGLVVNFSQSSLQGQAVPISRVGLSYEQAQEVISELQQAMLRNKYLPTRKLLPPGNK